MNARSSVSRFSLFAGSAAAFSISASSVRAAAACLAILGMLACSCGGSDGTSVPPADRTAPEVRLLFPFSREPLPTLVFDSTDVYVAARDSVPGESPGQIARVEFSFQSADSSTPTRIGEVLTSISLEEVSDSTLRSGLDLPAGWSLYVKRWYTGFQAWPSGTTIPSGSRVRLFAAATDAAGNQGRTPDSLLVRVINTGDNMPVFMPIFFVVPQAGRVGEEFSFDPTQTADEIDLNSEIRVRWDFGQGTGNGWDIDWEADARADQIVHHTYSLPGNYRVSIEAHNSYLPDSITSFTRDLRVNP